MTTLIQHIVSGNLVQPLESIGENVGRKYSIAPEVADILRQEAADTKINGARTMDFGNEIELGSIFSGEAFNGMQEQVNNVMKNNDWIAETLLEELGIPYLKGMELFHSPGAVSIMEGGRVMHASYNVMGTENGQETQSAVSRAYPQHLQGMSLQKATIASIFHAFRGQFIATTTLMQAVITLLGEDISKPEYYRGLYSHEGMSVGVSGSYVSHDIIERIIAKLDPYDAINLDKIAPYRKNEDTGEEFGRVDLLAGIFDELFARLLLHDVKDWINQIDLVAEDIRHHFAAAQVKKKNEELGKLC